jgi:hypothetical protein
MMQEIERIADRQKLVIEALKAAHHALTTVHGLWATDLWPGQDTQLFRIDKLKALAMIEEALGDE